MGRREKRPLRNEVEALIAEAVAVLGARPLATHPLEKPSPSRDSVSLLAHADWVALSELGNRFPLEGSSLWDGALVYLAGELLLVAGTPDRLSAVQQAGLVPLELDLLAGTCQVPATALDLVMLVRPELARVRSRLAHPSAGRLLPG